MKRILIALLLLSSLALPAADHHDISLSFGHSMYKWPEKGISFSYGVNIGLSARWEMNIWGISEAVPRPFGSSMFGLDFTYALLGPRSTASKIAGTGLNTLLSIGGFYRTDMRSFVRIGRQRIFDFIKRIPGVLDLTDG